MWLECTNYFHSLIAFIIALLITMNNVCCFHVKSSFLWHSQHPMGNTSSELCCTKYHSRLCCFEVFKWNAPPAGCMDFNPPPKFGSKWGNKNRETQRGRVDWGDKIGSNRETLKWRRERLKKGTKRGREKMRVVFYHPRDSSFSQIRNRKQEATGNCFT